MALIDYARLNELLRVIPVASGSHPDIVLTQNPRLSAELADVLFEKAGDIGEALQDVPDSQHGLGFVIVSPDIAPLDSYGLIIRNTSLRNATNLRNTEFPDIDDPRFTQYMIDQATGTEQDGVYVFDDTGSPVASGVVLGGDFSKPLGRNLPGLDSCDLGTASQVYTGNSCLFYYTDANRDTIGIRLGFAPDGPYRRQVQQGVVARSNLGEEATTLAALERAHAELSRSEDVSGVTDLGHEYKLPGASPVQRMNLDQQLRAA